MASYFCGECIIFLLNSPRSVRSKEFLSRAKLSPEGTLQRCDSPVFAIELELLLSVASFGLGGQVR